MVLSFAATNIQLGLLRHAGVVMTALKLPAALSTRDRAMKAASHGMLLSYRLANLWQLELKTNMYKTILGRSLWLYQQRYDAP
jgi:hypothetical protein